jgi:uncharacterized membrane protein YjgN (DUF898 family)
MSEQNTITQTQAGGAVPPGEADPELRMMVEAPKTVGNEQAYRFTFTGQWQDYFRIWVVNTFLTIISLGLWSPWAKIRKKKWFLGNTWVADSNFDYHANPWPILRGRLIAAAAFFVYWMSGNFQPHYAAWVALALAMVAPFLIIGSIRFNLTNTSYRNLRFSSRASLKDAALAMWPFVIAAALAVVFPLEDIEDVDEFFTKQNKWVWLSSLLFFVAYPYVHGALRLLVLNQSRFGDAWVQCSTRIKTFYSSHIRGSLIGIGVIIAASIVVAFGSVVFGRFATAFGTVIGNTFGYGTAFKIAPVVFGFLISTPFIFASLVWYAATQTRLINGTFNSTRIGSNVRVLSEIRTIPMAKLYFWNTVLIVFTLGLAIPWAAVRTAKQRVETTSLAVTGDLDSIVAQHISAHDPTADAATDFFSMDVSL